MWGTWAPVYRDVWVVDADNVLYGAYNLTSNSLAVPANYDALKAMFLAAAGGP